MTFLPAFAVWFVCCCIFKFINRLIQFEIINQAAPVTIAEWFAVRIDDFTLGREARKESADGGTDRRGGVYVVLFGKGCVLSTFL